MPEPLLPQNRFVSSSQPAASAPPCYSGPGRCKSSQSTASYLRFSSEISAEQFLTTPKLITLCHCI
jgi:hypothetical protein